MSEFQKELDRLKKAMKEDTESLRSLENYNIEYLDYPFGKRMSLRPKSGISYEDLQGSRSLDISQDMTEELYFEKSMDPINEIDNFRISEIEKFNSVLPKKIFNKELNFFEIGFRCSKLMKYYESIFKRSSGCDVVKHSVNVAKVGGYDAYHIDMNNPSDLGNLLDDTQLVVSYQVFEHLFDPLRSLKMLYKKMRPGSYLHIEVPTEEGIPRVRYSHVYAFYKNDLENMLKISGFQLVNSSTDKHPDQPLLQRCLAFKSTD